MVKCHLTLCGPHGYAFVSDLFLIGQSNRVAYFCSCFTESLNIGKELHKLTNQQQ